MSGPLRSEPTFVRWAAAEGISLVGSAVTGVVLPLVVYQTTGSAAQTGLLFAIRVVPYLLFGLVAGPLADRGNRRRLIIGGNLIQGTLVATIPIAHLLGILTVAQVFIVALIAATVFVFSDAAVFGAVPALVGPERLPAANGLLASIAASAEIAGPVVAGIFIATIGADNAVWVDAVSFFVAAAIQVGITSTFREINSRPAGGGIRRQIGRSFAFIRRERTVATLLVAGFGNSFAFGIVLGLLVPYAAKELHVGSHDSRVGLLYAALGVGSLFAGLIFSRIFRTDRIRLLTPGALGAAGFVTLMLAGNSQWVPGALLLTTFSLLIGTAISVGITYRQLVSPDDLRSSINVIGRMISWGGQPFGAAVGALIAASSSVPSAYYAAAGVMFVSAAGAGLSLATRVKPFTST